MLDGKTREKFALLTAQQNSCDYCLSAHSAIGKMIGLGPEEIRDGRDGNGSDAKQSAALTFAGQVLDTKGQVSASDLSAARSAGLSDA